MKYKILFVHNKYGVFSGEEAMINRIMRLLADHGHQVEYFSKDSKVISTGLLPKIAAFFSGIYSISSKRELAELVAEFRPDIVQIQNLFPLISPSVLPMLKRMGIPVVMRLSNYRLICPNGLFLSHGKLCERCKGGREYWCILRNCEKSWFKSIGYALRNLIARRFRFYIDNVTRYYSQTEFQRDMLISEGYPSKQIDLIPNMVQTAKGRELSKTGEFVGYVGRMSFEKGIDVFLETAIACPEIPFKIAGDQGKYQLIDGLPKNVELLGHLDAEALEEFYMNSRFIVVPSLCYEGFPGVIIEAMSYAKPVIASRIGGLPEIIEHEKTGLLFEPGNVSESRDIVKKLWDDEKAVWNYGQAGMEKMLKEYTPELYYKRLEKVYGQAIEERRHGVEPRKAV